MFSHHLGFIENGRGLSNALFRALLIACERALDISIEKGSIISHEAKSNLRYRLIRDEVLAIKKNVEFLASNQKLNIGSILTFEAQYRDQIQHRHGRIIPPSFYDARKLAIDSIYVCPDFYTSSPYFSEASSEYFYTYPHQDKRYIPNKVAPYQGIQYLITKYDLEHESLTVHPININAEFSPEEWRQLNVNQVSMGWSHEFKIEMAEFLSRAYRVVVLGRVRLKVRPQIRKLLDAAVASMIAIHNSPD